MGFRVSGVGFVVQGLGLIFKDVSRTEMLLRFGCPGRFLYSLNPSNSSAQNLLACKVPSKYLALSLDLRRFTLWWDSRIFLLWVP